MKDAVTTCVLHHPLRPVDCLDRALRSLDKATKREHHVEVIVQGPLMEGVQLPDPKSFEHIQLVYFHNKQNLGNALPLNHSEQRFLKTDHMWWAKCDDDMSFPSGGWDNAIDAILAEDKKGEFKCGCAFLAVPMPMWSARPRNFSRQKRTGGLPPTLQWEERGYANRNNNSRPRYIVCDFADHGCTVFRRSVFEDGCAAESRLFTGGVDFDMCFQMLDKGYKSIFVTDPRSAHHHDRCKPFKYGVIRYDPKQTNRSGQILLEKWGVEIEFLTKFQGLPQYMRKKQEQKKKDALSDSQRYAAMPTGDDWHRKAVGPGEWGAMGRLQFNYLVSRGLQPESYLLEVGCGPLRAGVHIIDYLDAGRYFGIDNEHTLLEAAQAVEIPRAGLEGKMPMLSLTDSFDLSFVPGHVSFDFVWAHSVFTQLPRECIRGCMVKVRERMKPSGVFYATFNESPRIDEGNPHPWRNERTTTRYPRRVIQRLADEANVTVEFIGDWGTIDNRPRVNIPGKRQQMLAIRRK
jgi:SAM-dependent methyltransferase/GT2 family glycosyltransferase